MLEKIARALPASMIVAQPTAIGAGHSLTSPGVRLGDWRSAFCVRGPHEAVMRRRASDEGDRPDIILP